MEYAKTDFGLYTASNQFRVADWKTRISPKDMELYRELQKAINFASEDAIKNRLNYSHDKLKVIARSIIRSQSEQNKIIYKYDFERFVEEVFSGEDGLQDKVKTPNFHIEMYNAFQQSKRVCVVCPRGHGKQVSDNTDVLTTSGWKKHGELTVGDYVFSPSGKPIKVTWISEKTPSDYVVKTIDREEIRCHGSHEWTVLDRNPRRMITIETKDMIGDWERVGRSRYLLPERKALNYKDEKLLIDPYFLGLWLGDGSAGKPCITHSPLDISSIDSIPYTPSASWVHKNTGAVTTNFANQDIVLMLRELGCLQNKHIPEVYFSSSIGQRLELLAGLIDSDGYLSLNKIKFRFVNTNKRLIDDVYRLVLSLGARPYISKQEPHSHGIINAKKTCYTVGFSINLNIPCRLDRKSNNRLIQPKKLGIISVKYDPNGEIGHCIEVDSDDGLYLVGKRLIPTHNSSVSRLYILHQILNAECRYVIFLGSSEDMAGQNMRWVRDQLIENTKIMDIYGNLQGKGKWAETEFITSTGIKVVAKGAGQKIRGANEKGRPDLVYVDDLESDDEVGNKENRYKLANWFTRAVMPIRSKDGRFIVTGTILHVDSLLKNIALNRHRDHIPWSVLWYQALYANDSGEHKSLWPEMHPVANLLELKRVNEQTFAQEYQNNPSSGGMMVFNKAWYTHFLKSDIEIKDDGVYMLGKLLEVIITTDLAISEREGADYTVIMVSGMDERGVLYVLDINRFRTADIFDIINEIFIAASTWHCDFVSIETVSFQRTIKKQIEREFEARRQFLHIEEMTRSRTTKMARIKSLQAPIKSGKIQWLDEHVELENELDATTATRLPSHDDVCFVAGTKILTSGGQKNIEDIVDGDMVMTRHGYQKVLSTANRIADTITKIGLTGTPNHPIITNIGIIPLQNINESNIVYIWNEKQLCLMESRIIDIQNQKECISETISGVTINGSNHQDHCIEMFGRFTMGIYRKNMSYIIRMVTRSIMILKTWSAYLIKNICQTICLLQKTKKECDYKQKELGRSQRNGMAVQRALHGTGNTQKTQYTKKRVYNLKVDNHPEYIANGVLVHNCDALADAWELQTEKKASSKPTLAPVNTMAWLIEQGRCRTSTQLSTMSHGRTSHFKSRY